jgi:hypothetical protein
MILLWGLPDDAPLAAVHAALERRGESVLFIDQRLLADAALDLEVGADVRASLRFGSRLVDLDDVTAVYVRPYDVRDVQGDDVRTLSFEDALVCWCELTPALVVNRPSAMASNNSKPYQAALIRAHGLRTPDTLVTTDPAAAAEFAARHGEVIYKSVSGVRSIVARLTPAHRDRLANVETCPTQFQERIEGVDVRLHVVGETTFACEIESGADDYRYASRTGDDVRVTPTVLPDEVAERCLALVDGLGLAVAGVDLRRRPDGEWFCFEVNPSPGFSFYEAATGQPIGEAVAALLAGGPVAGRYEPMALSSSALEGARPE